MAMFLGIAALFDIDIDLRLLLQIIWFVWVVIKIDYPFENPTRHGDGRARKHGR